MSDRLDRLDRVLRAIDSGLQSSGETGHTFDAGGCARCQQVMPVTDGGDLCPGCKAFLLGDGPEPGRAATSSIDLASAYAAVGISVAMAASRVMRSAYEVWRDEVGLVNPPNAETSPDVQ